MRAKELTSPLAGLIVLGAAFIAVFFGTLGHILNTWFSARGSHGPIIVGISLYMVWMQRAALTQLAARPQMLWGSAATVVGCLVLIAGKLTYTLLIQYVAFLTTMLGLVLLLGGYPYIRTLGLPLAYLSFTFPFFSELLERVSDQLQSTTAWIAYLLLKMGGVPAWLSGQFIELPSVSMEVARECNGVNHMVALVALAVPLAFWTQRTWQKRTVLITAALAIALLANGVRVAAIGYLSYYITGTRLHGPYDVLYVPFVFFFGMILLLLVGRLMGWRDAKNTDAQTVNPAKIDGPFSARQLTFKPVVIAVVILTLTTGYLHFFKPAPVYLTKPLSEFPMTIGPWVGHDADLSEAPFSEFAADMELRRTYRDGRDNEVKLYVGYFAAQTDEKKVVSYRFDMLQRGAKVTNIPMATGMVNVKQVTMPFGGRTEQVFFFYEINGRIIVNRYAAKLATLFDAMVHQRTNAAIIVAVSREQVNGNTSEEYPGKAFVKDVLPLVQAHLL